MEKAKIPAIPAERLASLLEESGVHQVDLCAATFYSPQHVSAVINGRKPLSQRFASDVCDAFERGIPTSAGPVVIHGLLPGYLMGFLRHRTAADAAIYEQHVVERIFDHKETLDRELNLDECYRRFLDALGYSIAIARDADDEPIAFVRRYRDGADVSLSKERLDAVRYAICSFADFSFSRLFEQEGATADVSTKK